MATFTEMMAKLGLDVGGWHQGLSDAQGGLEGFADRIGSKMTSVGGLLSGAITVPITAIGVAAFSAGKTVDEAFDTIRVNTGATGAALQGLQKDFRAVFGAVPSSAAEASTAIADLNTRLGLTGEPLQNLATQLLNLARITGTSVAPLVATTTRAFGDWSIETDKQTASLDFMFKTSQSTGIGIERLMSLVVQFGAPMRALGFSFQETNALMGRFEKEGVNLETVMSGLRFALGEFAKAGKEPRQAFQDVMAAIKGAGSESEATAIAFQTFGKRAAIDMSRAVLEGRFEIDALVQSLSASSETINTAAAQTADFAETWTVFKNRLTLALEPLGTTLLLALDNLLQRSQPLIDWLMQTAEWFGQLSPQTQNLAIAFGAVTAAIGPVLVAMGLFVKTVAPLVTMIGGAAGLVAGLKAVAIAAAAAAAVWAQWKLTTWLFEISGAKRGLDLVTEAIKNLWEWFKKLDIVKNTLAGMTSAQVSHQKATVVLTDSTKKLTDEQKKHETQLKKVAAESKGLGSEVKKLTATKKEHQEQVKKLDTQYLAWLNRFDDLKSKLRETTTHYEEFTRQVKSGEAADAALVLANRIDGIVSAAVHLKDLAIPVFAKDLGPAIQGATAKGQELEGALKSLGVSGQRDLQTIAAEAAKARDVVLGSDIATDFERKSAIYRALRAQVDAAIAAHQAVTAEQRKTLSTLETELGVGVDKLKAPWHGFSNEVSTIFTNFAQSIGKSLFDGDLSFGEKMKTMLRSLGEATVSLFVKPFTDAIAELISGAIANLLGGKGLGGILDGLKGIGGLIGAGGKAAGAAGSASGSAGSAVGSAAGGGASGAVGAVAGVVSAVSDVIGNFQMAGMNKSLDLIEHEVRFSQIHLLHLLEKANQEWPALSGIHSLIVQFLDQHAWRVHDIWEVGTKTLDAVRDLGWQRDVDRRPAVIQFIIDGRQIAEAIVEDITALQFQPVRSL